jgi:glyoxylase-like metal-dependent hydrolase (beta-lactamase superfamily II)
MSRPATSRVKGVAGLLLLLLIAVALGLTRGWWPGRSALVDRPGPSEQGETSRTQPAPLAEALVAVPVQVAPGVYLLGKTSPAAAYAVDTTEGLVLVDSGAEQSAAIITDQLSRLGLDVSRLRAILLTHAHADHSIGAAHLREKTGARVYAGRGDCPPLRAGGPPEAFFSIYNMPKVALHPTTVDVALDGGESIDFGETRFTVIATPGHTPGSVCYLLERPGLRALFTGDVVLKLSPAGDENLGTYTVYLPPVYRGSARDYLTSLRHLRQLALPDMVLPGHPKRDAVPQNPHLSAERWHAILDKGIAEMERTLARYDADGASFLDGTPRQLLPGLRYLGDCEGRAVYALAAPAGLFIFDAPGGAALVGFLEKHLKEAGWEGRKIIAVLLTAADEEPTSGLLPLVKRYGCRVVAARSGHEAIRARCPPGTALVAAEDIDKQGWFDVRPIVLQGRGLAPVAYELRWAGKSVLVSGRIPIKMSLPEGERLVSDVAGSAGSVEGYRQSLDQLAKLRPALWLPAVPVYGQNANLYDDEWDKVLSKNRQVFP